MTITTQQIVTMLVGVVAPLLVGLVTKASWGGNVRAIVLVTISVLTGIGQGFIDTPPGEVWDWQMAVFSALTAWVVAVASHFGLWKPTGASAAVIRTLVKDAPSDEPMPIAA